jgi:hypothetical protein
MAKEKKARYVVELDLILETFQYWSKQPKLKERSNQLTELREQYDVSKTGAERIVKDMGKHFKQKKPKKLNQKQKGDAPKSYTRGPLYSLLKRNKNNEF